MALVGFLFLKGVDPFGQVSCTLPNVVQKKLVMKPPILKNVQREIVQSPMKLEGRKMKLKIV